MKTETNIPTSDRLAKQPYFTLIDIFKDILPSADKRPTRDSMSTIQQTEAEEERPPPQHKAIQPLWSSGSPGCSPSNPKLAALMETFSKFGLLESLPALHCPPRLATSLITNSSGGMRAYFSPKKTFSQKSNQNGPDTLATE